MGMQLRSIVHLALVHFELFFSDKFEQASVQPVLCGNNFKSTPPRTQYTSSLEETLIDAKFITLKKLYSVCVHAHHFLTK